MGSRGEYVVAPSDDGRVFVWREAGGGLVAMLAPPPSIEGDDGPLAPVTAVAPHPTDPCLASAGADGVVRLWAPQVTRGGLARWRVGACGAATLSLHRNPPSPTPTSCPQAEEPCSLADADAVARANAASALGRGARDEPGGAFFSMVTAAMANSDVAQGGGVRFGSRAHGRGAHSGGGGGAVAPVRCAIM